MKPEARSQFTCIAGRTRSSQTSPAQLSSGDLKSTIEEIRVNRRSKRVKNAIPVADSVPPAEVANAGDQKNTIEETRVSRRSKRVKNAIPVTDSVPAPAVVEVVDGGEGIAATEKKKFTRRAALVVKKEDPDKFGAPTRKNLEPEMSKKVGLGRSPINLRKVLESGLLEGVRVFYNFEAEGKNLQGIIKGVGILCSCSLCVGTKVISPSQFELHACKQYRHAIKHIHLENGKSLLEVIEICKASDSVEVALQTVISSLPMKGLSMCTKCNGLIEASSTENLLVCDSCVNKKQVKVEARVATRAQVRDSVEVALQTVNSSLPVKGPPLCTKCNGLTKAVSTEKLLVCDSCVHKKKVEAKPSVVNRGHVRASSSDPKASTENLLVCDSRVNKKQVEGEPSVAPRGQVRASSLEPKASESNISPISFENKKKRGRPRKASSLEPKASESNISPVSFENKKKRGRPRKASSLNPKASETNTSPISFDNKKKRGRPRKSSMSASLKPVTSPGKFKVSGNKRNSKILERSPTSASASRSIKSATECTSSQQKSGRKLTTKNQQFHWLVFQEGGLPERAELTYAVRGKIHLVGYKSGSGILCSCCNTELSPSQFEAHAGWASRRKPYEHIYISTGVSLHEYAVSLKKKQNQTHPVKYNNDMCRVCKDGDLLLGDACPTLSHQECLQSLKVNGESASSSAAGQSMDDNPMEQTKAQGTGMKPVENIDLGACVLCRCHDFSKIGFTDQTVIVCDQCEREYHIGCLREHNMADLKKLPKGEWFCRNECERINSILTNMLTRQPETLSDGVLTFWREKQRKNNNNSDTDSYREMKFIVLRGKTAACKSRKLLAQTVKIFHEGFEPIIDVASGRDFIPSMVYGRKIWSQDFAGMLCAMLTVDSKVVTAGTLRVFDEDVAELPIVATSKSNQGKGYFQLLFTCIEKLLSSLKIKKIVLPAADDARSLWTQKFGFETIAMDQLNELRQTCPAMMSFQGTSILQKEVVQTQDVVGAGPNE